MKKKAENGTSKYVRSKKFEKTTPIIKGKSKHSSGLADMYGPKIIRGRRPTKTANF